MDSHFISSLTLLLLIACLVALGARRMQQPYTVALVLVGLVIALTKLTPAVKITHDLIFTIILPPLLFQGAMHMDMEDLKKNWHAITLLAVPGVLCSTLLVGFLVQQFWGIELLYALLFGALITPTDPISVLAILKQIGAPKRLRVMLEGESLFNDGTGVVIFTVILGLVSGHQPFSLGKSFLNFLIIAGGGALVGAALGYLVYCLLKTIEDHLLEVSLSVVLTFGTPLLAEAFHLSGIIAVVVAGLIIGNYGRYYSMSHKTRVTLETFWEVIDFLVNSLLFLIIGIELQEISKTDLIRFSWPIASGIIAVMLSRFLVVYPIVDLKNKLTSHKVPAGWNHVLFWGGLKGSIPLALAVGLPPDIKYRSLFLTVSFGIVLFSLVVQGLTVKPLVKRLGIMHAE